MTAQDLIAAFDVLAEAPDGIKRLRELILQLAVRGKLVPQDPTDEPASVLLERIAAEKARLVRQGKIRKEKATAEVSYHERTLDLSPNWTWCRLDDIVHDHGQKVPNSRFSYIDVASIDNANGVISDNLAVIEPENAPTRARKIVTPGTVIYSTVRPYLLNVAVVEREYSPEPIASTAFAILHPHGGVLDRFLFYLLRSPLFVDFVAEQMKGVAYPAINDRNLMNASVQLPPTAEQHRIVARVDELMGLLDRLETARTARDATRAALRDAALAALRNADTSEDVEVAWNRIAERMDDLFCKPADIGPLRQAVLQLAVRGRLVPQNPDDEPASVLLERIATEKARLVKEGKIRKEKPLSPVSADEVPFEVPAGWVWCRLGDIALKITDGEHQTPQRAANGHYLLSARNVHDDGIRLGNVDYVPTDEFLRIRMRCDPQKGDILISCSGSVGRVAIVDRDDTYAMVRSVAMVKPHHPSIDCEFVASAVRAPVAQDQVTAKTKQSAQANLFLGRIAVIVLPIPPLTEQHRIVAKVDELMALLERLEERLGAVQATQAAYAAAAVDPLDA